MIYRFSLVLLLLLNISSTAVAQGEANGVAAELDSLMHAAHGKGILNGNVLVARSGEIVYEGEFGYADAKKTSDLTKEHRFNIGSISKEFSAVGLMMFSEQGRLSLDDPVSRFVSSLPAWADRVNVGHLLTYTSGLPNLQEDDVESDEDILDDLRALERLEFEPGTGFLYSNNNIFLRQRIIESVAGTTYGTFLRSKLFKPCGMVGAVVDPAPGAGPIPAAFDNAGVEDTGEIPWSGTSYVTARDLYQWSQCLTAETLITNASLRMLTKSYDGGKSALGMNGVEEGVIQWHGHVGSSYNFEAAYYANRVTGVTVVILTNNKNFQIGSLAMAADAVLNGRSYSVPQKSLYLALRTTIYRKGFEAGRARYHEITAHHRDEFDLSDQVADFDDTGQYLLRKDRLTDAVRVFQWATSIFPECSDLFVSLGQGYVAQGKDDRAAESFRHALNIDASNTVAKNELARLEM